jgi:hypothetical protein
VDEHVKRQTFPPTQVVGGEHPCIIHQAEVGQAFPIYLGIDHGLAEGPDGQGQKL